MGKRPYPYGASVQLRALPSALPDLGPAGAEGPVSKDAGRTRGGLGQEACIHVDAQEFIGSSVSEKGRVIPRRRVKAVVVERLGCNSHRVGLSRKFEQFPAGNSLNRPFLIRRQAVSRDSIFSGQSAAASGHNAVKSRSSASIRVSGYDME